MQTLKQAYTVSHLSHENNMLANNNIDILANNTRLFSYM